MATEYKLPYTGAEINSRLAKIDNMVTSINGTTPDSNGNVSINVDISGKEDVGIAANLVSTHNTASNAHNDIRVLVGTAQTTAEAALPKSGGTMEGILKAQNNTSYTTKQARNIFLIAEGENIPSGSNGDICFVYAP